ncbi:MarR family winged helix-turn-helix transcriptional regulator [Ruicaihuangia caeni]|uniref:MarR family transcriptional regulator n=1 Tax=Ruicaihuangia caeni TaxID=3042517 RepID=A0AAW6TD24_9MICO|nr:MarR family transcriptional regulator [Klugiella sp. YN-L-19]MDI2098972.1 MarR family transcriptional regulator [Klugiella sp. YN-L-19]
MPHTALPTELRLSIGRLARRLRAEKADRSISDSQLSALWRLREAADCTMGALSGIEGVTAPSMHRTVNALVDAGYVTRYSSPDDGRKVLLRLTDAGERVLDETSRRRDEWFTGRLRELDADELAIVTAAAPVIKKLANS